jgi:cobalamin biosynthesis protein CobD/CbiB
MSLKLMERIQTVKTVKFEVGRFTGSAIALLLLGLVATVSIFILKVAFTIAAIGILIKIFSRN